MLNYLVEMFFSFANKLHVLILFTSHVYYLFTNYVPWVSLWDVCM